MASESEAATPRKSAKPAKSAAAKSAVTPKPVVRETVYVAVAPKAEPRAEAKEEPKPLPLRAESRARSKRGPLELDRNGMFAYGLAGGVYAAEVLGSSFLGQATAEWYPLVGPIFFQFTAGMGSVQSSFSEEVVGADIFEHTWMLDFEALGGYAIDLTGKGGDGVARGLYPVVVAGMTAVWQGGVPNFGGVVGFGHRFPVPFMTRDKAWAMPVFVKDQIYSQKIRTTPSLTQNLVLTLGVQKYF